jgi:hypothetical protein
MSFYQSIRKYLSGHKQRTIRNKVLSVRTIRFQVESLEERCVPATYTVTAATDAALRAAIISANADASGTTPTIIFNIPSGTLTIPLTSMLPILENPNGIIVNGTNTNVGDPGNVTINGGTANSNNGDRIFFVGLTSDTPITGSITGDSGGSPIVLTTASTAGLATGQTATIAGDSDAGADGGYTITVLSGTTFQLNSTTGSGNSSPGGGTWTVSNPATPSGATFNLNNLTLENGVARAMEAGAVPALAAASS